MTSFKVFEAEQKSQPNIHPLNYTKILDPPSNRSQLQTVNRWLMSLLKI